jgi:hypothetical protein
MSLNAERQDNEEPDLPSIRQRAIARIQGLTAGQIFSLLVEDEANFRCVEEEAREHLVQQDDELEHHRHESRSLNRRIDTLQRLNSGLEIRLARELENSRAMNGALEDMLCRCALYHEQLANLQEPNLFRLWMTSATELFTTMSGDLRALEQALANERNLRVTAEVSQLRSETANLRVQWILTRQLLQESLDRENARRGT